MANDGLRVRLEHCQHRDHALRAAWMAGEALSRNGDSTAEFNLIPSTHGMFHIYVNDELVASHQHLPDAHLFPDLKDMMAATLARI